MNKKTKLVVGIAAGVVTAIISKAVLSMSTTAKAIQMKILSLDIKGFNKLYLKMQIFNPTKGTIKIDSISGEVYFNNKQIGVIQYFNQAPILPLAYTTFDNILVELTPQGGVILITEIISRSAKTGTFTITGKTYVKNVGVPFSQQYKVW